MRKKFLTALYQHSQKVYVTLFKSSQEWGIRREDLLRYDPSSLGYQLGRFLEEHQFELIPQVEQHDIYHVLTGYSIAVEDEVALQCLCFGNGKRSLYLVGAIVIGTLVLPEHVPHYLRSYMKGKRLRPFCQYDYRNLLEVDFCQFQQMIRSSQNQLGARVGLELEGLRRIVFRY